METKFTKGQWKQYPTEIEGKREPRYRTIIAGDGYLLPGEGEKDTGFNLTGYVSEANAKLIAAAPEMLTALKESLEALDMIAEAYGEPISNSRAYIDARSSIQFAIKKATE